MAIWLEVGGAAWSITDAACKRLYDLGARGIHCVTPDLSERKAELANIKKYGMTAISDIEVPLWVNTQMNASADISWAKPQLQAQANAGWQFFSSEGMGRGQVDMIRSVKPFINYGSENGANMYYGQYNHAPDAHFANSLETYHKWAITDYRNTANDSWAKCKNQGITLMMYAADLETDIPALMGYIDGIQKDFGITIAEVQLWCGVNSDIQMIFNEPWISIVKALKNKFGFRTDAAWTGAAPPPTPTTCFGAKIQLEDIMETIGINENEGSGPATCTVGNKVYVFVQGTDNAVWTRCKLATDANWTAWQTLGGQLTSSPAASVTADGTVFIFVRGNDKAVWYRSYNGKTWTAWATVGGVLQ